MKKWLIILNAFEVRDKKRTQRKKKDRARKRTV